MDVALTESIDAISKSILDFVPFGPRSFALDMQAKLEWKPRKGEPGTFERSRKRSEEGPATQVCREQTWTAEQSDAGPMRVNAEGRTQGWVRHKSARSGFVSRFSAPDGRRPGMACDKMSRGDLPHSSPRKRTLG